MAKISLTRRGFLGGSAGAITAVAVVQRPAWAENGVTCYVKLIPCDPSLGDFHTTCSEVEGLVIGSVVKDGNDDCYRIHSDEPKTTAPSGSTSVSGVEKGTSEECGPCTSCRTVWESEWNCDTESWDTAAKVVDNECGPCAASDDWEDAECADGKIIQRFEECDLTCQDGAGCSGATSSGPPPLPVAPPPQAEEYCEKKLCRRSWESKWDCENEEWSTPEEVGSAECDYCCESEEWEYDRCEEGEGDEKLVVYKWTQCDDGEDSEGEGCSETTDCASAGAAPAGPKIGEPEEAEDCCESPAPCTCPSELITAEPSYAVTFNLTAYCCDDYVQNPNQTDTVTVTYSPTCTWSTLGVPGSLSVCPSETFPDGADLAFGASISLVDPGGGADCYWQLQITDFIGGLVFRKTTGDDPTGSYAIVSVGDPTVCEAGGQGFQMYDGTVTVS